MEQIVYKIVRNKRRLFSTSISISPQREVVVTAPLWVPLSAIEKIVRNKTDWIKKTLARQNSRSGPTKKQYINGEKHLFFGEEYPLNVISSTGIATTRLQFLYNKFEAKVPIHHSPIKQKKGLEKAMLRWYLDHGKQIITQKVIFFTKLLGVTHNRIVLKKVSSIWGSCSRRNNLNFNRKLIMAPHKVVDYVVIHEVCHLVHHHHQKSFWNLVKSFDPDYKEHIKWLKQNNHLLTI